MTKKNTHIEAPNKTAVATLALICFCTLIHAACVFSSNGQSYSTDLLSTDPQMIWTGEIWRLVTGNFIHLSGLHLLMNCLVLLSLGRIVEPIFGPARLVLIYFVTAIAGSCASILLTAQISSGASAPLFGLAGALIGARLALPKRLLERQQLRSFLLLVLINLVLGVLANQWLKSGELINNVAHSFGLIFGILLGITFSADSPQSRLAGKSYHCLAACVGLFALLSITAIRPTFLPAFHLYTAHRNFEVGDFAEALSHADWLKKHEEFRGYGEIIAGRILLAEEKNEAALAEFTAGLSHIDQNFSIGFNQALKYGGFQKSSDALFFDEKGNVQLCMISLNKQKAIPQALNNCAWLLLTARDFSLRNPKLALSWAKEAVHNSPVLLPQMLDTLAQAYEENGNTQEALMARQRASMTQNPLF